jgi:Trk K+ transport system NAD-binding subunit
VVVPQPETVLTADDEILAITEPAQESTLRDALVGA